jgi:hypothetical protein
MPDFWATGFFVARRSAAPVLLIVRSWLSRMILYNEDFIVGPK